VRWRCDWRIAVHLGRTHARQFQVGAGLGVDRRATEAAHVDVDGIGAQLLRIQATDAAKAGV
jgi:hypothetical protein